MKIVNSRLNLGAAVTKALSGKWITVSELSEILNMPATLVYQELCQLSRTNGAYVLLLRTGADDARVLMLPTREWQNLLRYIALLPRAA